MEIGKSYPLSMFVNKPRKAAKFRSSKHAIIKAVATDREVKKNSVLQLKTFHGSAESGECYSRSRKKNYPVKVNVRLSALENTFLCNITTDQSVTEHTHLHLILSDYLSTTDAENLNKTSKSFNHFHSVLLHTKPDMIFNFFHSRPD